ncbi:MAG TPA: hypothetical protein VMY40_05985 [Anaerolineae bacterium]|nr:hypothetical protein [Anaerolineae bacterium]
MSSIDGVGEAYASGLSDNGIRSLGDLVGIDPRRRIGNIPAIKLREFQAKARLVTRLRVSPSSLEPFADQSVSQFLGESPEDLVRPGVTLKSGQRLQETLMDLQIALGNAQLRQITLGDLMNA